MPLSRDLLGSTRIRLAVHLVLAVFAIALCWADVCWALRPGLFPILDELSNPTLFLDGSYHQIVHFFPAWFFCDRPLGWAFVKLMSDFFQFDYTRQVECFLVIHVANCAMVFLLFRRLGVGLPISIAGAGLFGSLWTTAATATYPGAAHDMICLFFLLGSVHAILAEWRGSAILSALLFLAALRSKEFGIVTPVLLTVLVALRLPRMPVRQALASVGRRLWLHYLIVLVFGIRYLTLLPGYLAGLKHDNPYRMDFHVTTVMKSLAYYTALIFGADGSRWQIPPLLLTVALAAILGWAVFRHRAGVAFGVCGYVLTLLPVCLMPNQRAQFYAYAPQVFLLLALCLLAEEAIALLGKRERLRWTASVCLALACLLWCVAFRRSPYFHDRVKWTLGVRRTSLRTARDLDAQLPPMGPGAHVYVNHNSGVMPWLFVAPDNCSYLELVNRQRVLHCVTDKPTNQLRALYARDQGEKYFLDYHNDGSVALIDRSRPAPVLNR